MANKEIGHLGSEIALIQQGFAKVAGLYGTLGRLAGRSPGGKYGRK